jgi:hypothetical protein
MELEGVEGVEGKLKVWIRRVWTLEMVRSLNMSGLGAIANMRNQPRISLLTQVLYPPI